MSGQTNYYRNWAKCGKPTCKEESNVTVEDKRTFFYKAWSNHKMIFILGFAGLTYVIYKKYYKK
jgi:hypothetical protein